MSLVYRTKEHPFCSGWNGFKHEPHPTYAIVTVHLGPDKRHYCFDCWASMTQDTLDDNEMLRVATETEDI